MQASINPKPANENDYTVIFIGILYELVRGIYQQYARFAAFAVPP